MVPEYIARDFYAMMAKFESMDLCTTPAYRFMITVTDVMVDNGIPRNVAEQVATSMDIKICDGAGDDVVFINDMAQSIGRIAGKLWTTLSIDFQDPVTVMLKMAKNFNLHIVY
jgi:hypothetical protein